MAACFKRLGVNAASKLDITGVNHTPPPSNAWPPIQGHAQGYTRRTATHDAASEPSYIARLVSVLPAHNDAGGEIEEYLEILDKVLEDRRVTEDEGAKLLALAEQGGLSRSDVAQAHTKYMLDLCRVAWRDGVITESEQRDLEDVRELLQISSAEYLKVFEQAEQEYEDGASFLPTENEPVQGKTVCFTGALQCRVEGRLATRDFAERLATEKGMQVKNSCTKKLDFLVVADADSMSGKTKKARGYGVRIIAEPVFWRMMRVDVE